MNRYKEMRTMTDYLNKGPLAKLSTPIFCSLKCSIYILLALTKLLMIEFRTLRALPGPSGPVQSSLGRDNPLTLPMGAAFWTS